MLDNISIINHIKINFYIILIIFIIKYIYILYNMSNSIEEVLKYIKSKVIDNTPTVIISILIFLIFSTIANYCKNLFVSDRIIFDEMDSNTLVNSQIGWLLYYIIYIIGLIFAIINLGVNISTIITLLATFGLAFGLALQGTIVNIINGILFSLTGVFSIGDRIKIHQISGDSIEGIITTVNLLNIVLLEKKNNNLITIPNSLIQANMITNYTKSKKSIYFTKSEN